MFALKTGMKCMNHRVSNTYRSKLDAAWIVAFLFVIKVAH
jgi:hypothetical protein